MPYYCTLKIEAAASSETVVTIRHSTQRHNRGKYLRFRIANVPLQYWNVENVLLLKTEIPSAVAFAGFKHFSKLPAHDSAVGITSNNGRTRSLYVQIYYTTFSTQLSLTAIPDI